MMKPLLKFSISSLSTSTIITALSLPQTGSNHALSIRGGPFDESRVHDYQYNPDPFQMIPNEHPYNNAPPGEVYWDPGAQIPVPSYAFHQSQDPTFFHDGSYTTNMGLYWPEFDQEALYGTPMIGPGGEFVPTMESDFNALDSWGSFIEDFGLDFVSDLAPVVGPQVLPGSYQQTISQQVTAEDTKDVVSGRAEIQAKLDGRARKYKLPEGVRYVEGGTYLPGLGIPVIARNGKILYLNSMGNLRDTNKHPYNADGKRYNVGTGVLNKNTRKKYLKPNGKKGAVRKREDLIGDIRKIEVTSSTNITSSQSQSNQFSKYLNTYYAVQANVSSLVLPFVKGIIGSTNNTLIRDVAISAYVEIVGFPVIISSPFVAGMNCLGWLEKQYFEGTNSSVAAIIAKPRSNFTSDDIASLHYFASYQTLLSVYNNAYYNGSKVANSTGLLDTLYQLKRYLFTNDTSIMPEEFTRVNTDYIKQLFP